MRTKIITIGNSKGLRIPKVLLEESGIEGEVDIRVSADGLTIARAKRATEDIAATALVSERVLGRDWNRPDEDAAWRDL